MRIPSLICRINIDYHKQIANIEVTLSSLKIRTKH